MVSRNLAGVAVANLVDGNDSELVLCVFHQAGHHEFGGLEFLRDVALGPLLGVGSLALHQISNDLTATIVSWFGPAEADRMLGRVHHLGERRWARRILRITHKAYKSDKHQGYFQLRFSANQTLTDGVNSQSGVGRIAGFAQAGLVQSDDSEFVL